MTRTTIRIYSDKKFATIIFIGLFSASTYFTVSIWCDNKSLFIKLLVTFVGLLFISISSFGVFTLVSKRFRYYGRRTPEYIQSKAEEQNGFLIFDDRIQSRANTKKVVYFMDIVSITAIPNSFVYYDMLDDVLFNYLEIKYGSGKKVVLTEGHDFIKSFQQNRHTTVKALPGTKEIMEKFGKAKFIACSFLFEGSPIRVNLWTKE